MDKPLSKQKYRCCFLGLFFFCANTFGMSKRDSSELTRTFLFALFWQWDAQDRAQTVGIICKLIGKVVGHGTGLGSDGQRLHVALH